MVVGKKIGDLGLGLREGLTHLLQLLEALELGFVEGLVGEGGSALGGLTGGREGRGGDILWALGKLVGGLLVSGVVGADVSAQVVVQVEFIAHCYQ